MATPSDTETDSRFRGEAPENAIETAHALYRSELSNTSFSEVLLSWTSHFVFALVPEDVGMEEALTTEGPDGHTFIAVFTSLSRAAATVASAGLPHRPLAVSIFEVIFLAEPNFGLVINPTIPVWEWTFLSGELERLRTLLLTPLPLFERGSICAIRGAEYYQAGKILMVDAHGVHIRLYSNCWPSPPEKIDVSTLILDSEGPGLAMGIGHLPFTTKAFLAQGPVAFQQCTVTEEELDGYQIWQRDQGGYFAS